MSVEHLNKRYKNTNHNKEKQKSLITSFSDSVFNALVILIDPERYTDQQMVGDCCYFAAMMHYFMVCCQQFTVYFLEKGLFKFFFFTLLFLHFITLLSLPECFRNKCETTRNIQGDSVDKMFLLFPFDIWEGEVLEIRCLIKMRQHLLIGK